MTKLFNGKFEIALRVMMILNELNEATENDILAFDLVATYGKSFGIEKENLHGDNQFNFSEIATRKQMITAGIAYLRLHELVEEISDLNRGYVYRLTITGKRTIRKVDDDYSRGYRRVLQQAILKLRGVDKSQLFIMVNQYLMKELR